MAAVSVNARPRPVCFDVTHLVGRMTVLAPSGIDKVDLAYGRHFATRGSGPVTHYGLLKPHVLRHDHLSHIVTAFARHAWARPFADDDPHLARAIAWLSGQEMSDKPHALDTQQTLSRTASAWGAVKQLATRTRFQISSDGGVIPAGSIYLNIAQAHLERPQFFRWLRNRPDVTPVFMIHDLLPLDHPEFWPRGRDAVFARRIDTALVHGRAFIVASTDVRDRLAAERANRRLPEAPILVAPLPSTLDVTDVRLDNAVLSAVPYFVMLGTIEPRKNHLLVLNIWRRMVESGRPVPKLVIVGARGWENEQTLDVLDRSTLVRPHVLELSGLTAPTLARLVHNARALLMPSFAEGYGLPVVEALSLGTPVIASDLTVFREVTQGAATFLHPLDGLGWRAAIESLARDTTLARAQAAGFKAPDWGSYFHAVETFLESL